LSLENPSVFSIIAILQIPRTVMENDIFYHPLIGTSANRLIAIAFHLSPHTSSVTGTL
jgi:hypothetical protein